MELKELGGNRFSFVASNGQTYVCAPLDFEAEAEFDAWIAGETIRRLKAQSEIGVTPEMLVEAVTPPTRARRWAWYQSAAGGIQLVWLSLRRAKPDLTLEAVKYIMTQHADLWPIVLRLNQEPPPKAEAATSSPASGT